MPSQTHSDHSHSDSDSENNPPLAPNTNPLELYKIARRFEAEKNRAEADAQNLRRKLEDIGNVEDDDNLVSRPTQRRRTHQSPSPDDEDSDTEAAGSRIEEQFVYQAGHKFSLIHGLWIHHGADLFDANLDKSYSAVDRFENADTLVQGQLREIINLLQEKLQHQALHQQWVSRAFIKGLNTQRHNTATRIRRHCATILGVNDADLLQAEIRKAKFRDRIGWVSNESGSGSYSSVDVEILHKDYPGEYTLSSVFLNPILMGLYVALIRGPTAAKHFANGTLLYPQTETMARLHSIRNITPGSIATIAILARWALSCDESLQEVGSNTGINYFEDYEEYLEILESGLRRRKKSIMNVIKEWDERIFPNSDSSLAGAKIKPADDGGRKRAMDLLDADSEEETSDNHNVGS